MYDRNVNRYESKKVQALQDQVDRQRKLKQLLINIQNGAMITPIIFEIEQMYNPTEPKQVGRPKR